MPDAVGGRRWVEGEELADDSLRQFTAKIAFVFVIAPIVMIVPHVRHRAAPQDIGDEARHVWIVDVVKVFEHLAFVFQAVRLTMVEIAADDHQIGVFITGMGKGVGRQDGAGVPGRGKVGQVDDLDRACGRGGEGAKARQVFDRLGDSVDQHLQIIGGGRLQI